MSDLRQSSRHHFVFDAAERRRRVSAQQIATRRWLLLLAKLALPVLAVALLLLIVLWPELSRMGDQARLSVRRMLALEAESGRMVDPHYRSVDERSRPYTLTASTATQSSVNRVDLDNPNGDMMLENGTWMQVQSKTGSFIQHTEQLDLNHDVVLYRDDGTVIRTDAASVDVKQGAASSAMQTHAEGPFGTLDAQGFMLLDKGNAIQFHGPARLVINQADKPAEVAP